MSRFSRPLTWLPTATSLLFVVFRFLALHRLSAPPLATPFAAFVASPVLPPQFGWWGWWDQGKVLEAATAFAHGVLTPALHYYLPATRCWRPRSSDGDRRTRS